LANSNTSPAYANALALLRGLRITEIMYNPLGGNDYEFLELRNTGSVPLDLTGVKFIEGIEFTFPSLTLNAGADIVLVANSAKFRERYGMSPNVGGTYSGRLDNSGEPLALQLPPPFDANILKFSFKSDWQSSTNGRGRSLVVTDTSILAGRWGDKDKWLFSPSSGGDPDGVFIAQPDRFSPWLNYHGGIGSLSDDDHDGLSSLLEYSFGMDPAVAIGGDGVEGSPSIEFGPEGRLSMRFLLPEKIVDLQDYGAPDILYTVEASSDLMTWNVIATKRFGQSWSGTATVIVGPAANGFVPVEVQDTETSATVRYLRVRASLQP
ncbi:MAG: lamin tail domain-containing protein, partial [Verrucomicrobiaceae bacterium]